MSLTRPTAGYFTFQFDKEKFSWDFINDLKDAVPSDAREYNPVTMVWTINELFYPEVRKLWQSYFIPDNLDLFGDD